MYTQGTKRAFTLYNQEYTDVKMYIKSNDDGIYKFDLISFLRCALIHLTKMFFCCCILVPFKSFISSHLMDHMCSFLSCEKFAKFWPISCA